MQIVHAKQTFPSSVTRSIFLAGPTPRDPRTPSWRPEMIRLLSLSEFGQDGTVFSPEPEDGKWHREGYEDQVDWESEALNRADCILFWVPRDMATMPALTTNVEFGEWLASGKVVLGWPPHAPDARRNRYLGSKAERNKFPVALSMEDLVAKAQLFVPKPYPREGAEAKVPIHIWQTENFQAWYRGMKAAGNRLDDARVVWSCHPGAKIPVSPFVWSLHVNIYVAKENRNKSNEIIISRKDISSVVLYRRNDENPFNTEIVLVREFRSPVRNSDGFVYEAPGGSSPKPNENPYTVAAEEVFEETGLRVLADRIQRFESRQNMATLSTHQTHLFAVELEEHEIVLLKAHSDIPHGNSVTDSEITYNCVMQLRELYTNNYVDWGMLGMIHRVIFGPNFIPVSPDQIP